MLNSRTHLFLEALLVRVVVRLAKLHGKVPALLLLRGMRHGLFFYLEAVALATELLNVRLRKVGKFDGSFWCMRFGGGVGLVFDGSALF